MNRYFSIGQAAKAARMTSEALRHYDRIGLVTPSKKDEWTNYRYYTEQDIVRLKTVRALQKMDLPLHDIKKVLEYDNLKQIVQFLTEAERRADEKIAELQDSKSTIQAARAAYESKLLAQRDTPTTAVCYLPRRVIMLSETLETPTVDTLWSYLRHFYDRLTPEQKEQFAFEDVAGVYTENGVSRLFAVCIRHGNTPGLKQLPAGNYLCAACTEQNRGEKLNELLQLAKSRYNVTPAFTVQQIVLSGILQWNYQIQIPLCK